MNWRDVDGYDGAKHPDRPEPADRTDPEPDDVDRFDPADDADLGPHPIGRPDRKRGWK